MQSMNTPSPYAEAYAKRTRRRNLWILFGFSLLVLTCLAGLFISLSTYNAANNAGLFIPAPVKSGSANPTAIALSDKTLKTQEATAEVVTDVPTKEVTQPVTNPSTSASTTASTTDVATALPIASIEQAIATITLIPQATPTPIDGSQPFPILTLDEAETLANSYPADVRAHLAFSIALSRANRGPRSQSEFATAFRLLNGDAALALEIGQSMMQRPALNGTYYPAMLFAVAYGLQADSNANLRAEAGQAIYTFTAKVNTRREALGVRTMSELVDSMKGSPTNMAGLYSFIALAFHNGGEDRLAKLALDKASILSEHLPEVLLVKGIIEQDQNDTVGAQVDLQAAASAAGAPQWLVDEAKRLAQKGS